MKKKVILLGEPLMRLSPEGNERFLQSVRMNRYFGGAEANVAVCLSGLGMDSYFVSKVPSHGIGQSFVNIMRSYGVNTEHIARGGDRMGIYFLENGASVRPSQAVYDRGHSSMTEIQIGEFDWEAVFQDASLLHISGITPVISEQAAEVAEYAMKEAEKRGISCSLDLNYRAQLWQSDVDKKQERVRRLARFAGYCFGNPLDAARTLGFSSGKYDLEKAEFAACITEEMIRKMAEEYDFEGIFFTVRESLGASFNKLSGRAYWQGGFYETETTDLQVVDRVGSGDAFAAGILYGILTGRDMQDTLEFGLATGAVAHTIPGDFTVTTEEEVEMIIKSGGSGRVQR